MFIIQTIIELKKNIQVYRNNYRLQYPSLSNGKKIKQKISRYIEDLANATNMLNFMISIEFSPKY